jgi:hypothetical protein
MHKLVMWMAAGAVLQFTPGATTRLEAQCMGCVSSSACGESGKRGSCTAQSMGTICACSDNTCRPTITAIPAAESPAQLAALDASGQERGGTLGVLVRYCDGEVEWLVYSTDGMRLMESRLLSPATPERLAQAETGRG